jgi:membrane anchored protein
VNTSKWFVVTLCLIALCAFAAPTAMMADQWDKATKLTFSEPVEVPGRVLPAGTYWFTLADSDSDRNIVQIWDADRMHLVTTILAVPDYRMQPAGRTVIHFEERPSDSPEAIHSWFYPGSNYGEEFVYPKVRATQLAKQTSRPVLSMPNEQASTTAQSKQVPVRAVTPSGEEIEVSEVVVSEPASPQQVAANALPKTASSIPLFGLLGLLSLAAGLGLRAAARGLA